MDAGAWAFTEFWGNSLGGLRLQRRLVDVAACIRGNPRGTLPQAVGDSTALKAAYRLLSNPKVTHEKLLQTHIEATRERCRVAGEYLMIEDSTALSFTQRASVKGMGPLTHETSQGFLAHTCLATHITRWDDENEPEVMLAGVFGQACWARERPQGTRKERKKTQRAQKRAGDPGESARWARAMANAGPMPAGVRWTLVADRECDIFGVLLACCAGNHDWVIRAARPRRTTSASGDVFATAATAPVLGRFDLKLRARPGVAARQAHLEVRAVTTGIVAPRDLPGQHAPQASQLVEVRELDPPPDVPALHWVLLTSWPCDTFAQARRVVGAYQPVAEVSVRVSGLQKCRKTVWRSLQPKDLCCRLKVV